MRLIDLDPRWLTYQGRRLGITFQCPCCRKVWLTCFVESGIPTFGDEWDEDGPMVDGVQPGHFVGFGQMAMWRDAVGKEPAGEYMVPCNKQQAWAATPPLAEATFDNLSFTPSLDASASGHWHGFITNGGIVG